MLLKEINEQAPALSERAPATLESPQPAIPLNKRKVLIIEDDNDIRELLKEEIGTYVEV